MKILCVGLMVCDVLVKPVSGELFSKDHTMVDALELSVGGDAFNVASNLKALGVESRLVSAVGKDRIGRFVRETLEDMGLETDGIMDSEMPTAATVVMISANGERHLPPNAARANIFIAMMCLMHCWKPVICFT